MIRFINGLFHTQHPLDSPVIHWSTEYIRSNLEKRQVDEVVSIAGHTYLIEAQTADDANMAIRVFEYSYAQALKNKHIHAGRIILPFPRAAVIYLEGGKALPGEWEIQVVFPPDNPHSFKIPTVKLLEYSITGMVEEGLAVLLPFYMLKLRKAVRQVKSTTERQEVEAAFREVGLEVKAAIEGCGEREGYSNENIVTLLERLEVLIQYIGRGYNILEVMTMVKESLMGYGKRLALDAEQKGLQEGGCGTAQA
jgi:PII-like signaling protein